MEPTRPGGAEMTSALMDGSDTSVMCGRCGSNCAESFHFCPACGCSLKGRRADDVLRDPLIGAVVASRYRLIECLGKGGMGTVYKVEHIHMGKLMAMKLLHGDLSRDETMVRRFGREARAISRLKGPHTAQIFDYGSADGLVYLVMEYLRGMDMGELLVKHRRLSPRRTADIVRQIAEGMNEAHAQNIVHRDLKPENVFVCAEDGGEVIKVLDFGLAKLQKREDSIMHTKQGMILGTPHYMSPEQIEGDDIDAASDIYSLGAVAFRTLLGQPPYPGDNVLRVLNAHLGAPVPTIAEIDEDLAYLQPFFDRALAKTPSERFPSCAELAQELKRVVTVGAAEVESTRERPYGVESGVPLLPNLPSVDSDVVATGADFDGFELRLRFKRIAVVLLSLAAVGVLAWVVVWGLLLGNFFDTSREEEPNDTLKEANELSPTTPVTGALGEPPGTQRADRDVYRIVDVEPGRMIAVDVTAIPDLDLILELVSSDGRVLFTQNAEPAGRGERVPNFPFGSGGLYVIVREVWLQGTDARVAPDHFYKISVDSRRPMNNEELEPNDGPPNASSLPVGSATGMLSSADDVDVFRTDSLAARSHRVEARVSGLQRTDIVLHLLDNEGKVLLSRDENGLAGGESVKVELDLAQVGQPLLLKVESKRGHTTEASYQIDWRAEPLD